MIQRIQTVYLILAFILLVVAAVLSISGGGTVRLIEGLCFAVSAVVTLVAVFLYHKRMRQANCVTFSGFGILLGFIVVTAVPLAGHAEPDFGAELAVAFFALLFNFLARRAIIKDEKLVRSADRIR